MASDLQGADLDDLRRQLEEAEETLRAIRSGEVDALVVSGPEGDRVFTLQGADHPYRALIESMEQGAASLDLRGTILYCNRRFAEMVARPLERVIGAAVGDFLPTANRLGFDLLMNLGRGQGEFDFQTPAQTLLPVYLAISSLPLNGETAFCLVATDLTEQKVRQGLQEANRRKDEFLAMLAHELRNPLAPIRNALYLLRQNEVDPSSAQDVRAMMERQVGHFSRLIDDLMDVSRISTGKIELRLDLVDLGSIVARAVEVSRTIIAHKNHELTIELPENPILLNADPTRIEQILENLLTNAAKYTDPGGHIQLSVAREGGSAVIRLKDDGIGIDPEKLPRIFDLFVQAERRMDRSQGGLGLGLSLVKSLVEMHGGTVSATSRGLTLGTEFTVRLPARPPEFRRTSPSPTVVRKPEEPALPRRRILVVDDNVDSARSMVMVLKRLWGQETEVAHDGLEALEKVETFVPEVILLDIGLPGMSGYDVARRLREQPQVVRPYLIAMTGLGQEDDIQTSRDSGFDHHLVKPIDLEVLRGLMTALPDLAT